METNEYQRLCNICDFQHINEPAVEWCPECDEYFCTKCKIQHGIGKATRNHEPVSIDDYEHIPHAILDLKQTCEEHDEKAEFYCSEHEKLCCLRCTRKAHRECTSLDSIQIVVKHVKSSAGFEDLEKNLNDLDENVVELKKNADNNLDSMETEKSRCRAKMKEYRLSVDKRLDELEEKVTDNLDKLHETQTLNVNCVLGLLSNKKTRLSQMKENMNDVKKYASDVQAFLFMRHINKEIHDEETNLESLLENPGLMSTKFIFTPFAGLSEEAISVFGHIEVETKDHPRILKRHKDNQAQISTSPKPETKTVIAQFTISFPPSSKKRCFRDCIVLSNGDMLLTDRNNSSLVLVSEDGSYKSSIELESEPFGLAFIGDNKVAVTSLKNKIYIVDLSKESTVSKFDIDKTPNGIQLHEGNLVVNVYEFGYYVLDMEGTVIRELNIGPEKMPYFVVKNDRIYCAKWESNQIVCYDMFVNIQWIFEHEKMKGPNGITAAENGDLFVVCFKSSNVMVVDSEGTKGTEVLNKLIMPINICFDDNTKRLIIGSNGRVIVYSVS